MCISARCRARTQVVIVQNHFGVAPLAPFQRRTHRAEILIRQRMPRIPSAHSTPGAPSYNCLRTDQLDARDVSVMALGPRMLKTKTICLEVDQQAHQERKRAVIMVIEPVSAAQPFPTKGGLFQNQI